MADDTLNRRGDTRAATWKRTVRRLRLDADRLRDFGYQVTEPAELDVHPDFRSSPTRAIVEVSPVAARER